MMLMMQMSEIVAALALPEVRKISQMPSRTLHLFMQCELGIGKLFGNTFRVDLLAEFCIPPAQLILQTPELRCISEPC